jgi:hypothetical protein
MKITYDTETDSISSPDLNEDQTRQLQGELVRHLGMNSPVRTVAASLMATALMLSQDND